MSFSSPLTVGFSDTNSKADNFVCCQRQSQKLPTALDTPK